MAFRAGSADEMAANADFQLLPEDEYLASVEEMEFVPKEDQQPSKFTPVPQDQYKAHLRIHSFADGADLEDTEGKPVAEFKIIQWINPNKVGMVPQPSRARKFFAALLRQPIANAIEIDNFPDDLIGKQLYVSTLNVKSEKGGTWTRAQDFRPIKIERNRRAAATESESTAAEAPREVELDEDELTF